MNKYFVTMAPSIQKDIQAEGYVIEAQEFRVRDGVAYFVLDNASTLVYSASAFVSIEQVTDEDFEYVPDTESDAADELSPTE